VGDGSIRPSYLVVAGYTITPTDAGAGAGTCGFMTFHSAAVVGVKGKLKRTTEVEVCSQSDLCLSNMFLLPFICCKMSVVNFPAWDV